MSEFHCLCYIGLLLHHCVKRSSRSSIRFLFAIKSCFSCADWAYHQCLRCLLVVPYREYTCETVEGIKESSLRCYLCDWESCVRVNFLSNVFALHVLVVACAVGSGTQEHYEGWLRLAFHSSDNQQILVV